jgi:hypothetical protein
VIRSPAQVCRRRPKTTRWRGIVEIFEENAAQGGADRFSVIDTNDHFAEANDRLSPLLGFGVFARERQLAQRRRRFARDRR